MAQSSSTSRDVLRRFVATQRGALSKGRPTFATRRNLASVASETETTSQGSSAASTSPSTSHKNASGPVEWLSTYLLVSRPPTIQRAPSAMEAAYYAYNSKLQRALAQPFVRDLYFKKGSAMETQFDKDEAERSRNAKAGAAPTTKPVESAQATEARSEDAAKSDVLSGDAEDQTNDADTIRTMPRTTVADAKGIMTSLDRSLDRTLYLLVRGGAAGEEWTLPFSRVHKGEGGALHKEAPLALQTMLGHDMDIWMVTNFPVGLVADSGPKVSQNAYIMRAHIIAGQPNGSAGGVEHVWVTSEEMAQRIARPQYNDLRDLLSV